MGSRAGTRPVILRLTLVWAVVITATTLVFVSTAAAQDPALDDAALLDQYMEDIPTATGSKASDEEAGGGAGGSGGSGGGQTPALSPATVQDLQAAVGKEDADRLQDVATSPRYGAPQIPAHPPEGGGLGAGGEAGSIAAAINALGSGGGESLLPLLLALVFATGALCGATVMRRRGPRVSP